MCLDHDNQKGLPPLERDQYLPVHREQIVNLGQFINLSIKPLLRESVSGHEPPRLQRADAAERLLIADTKADEWRDRVGPVCDTVQDNKMLSFRYGNALEGEDD